MKALMFMIKFYVYYEVCMIDSKVTVVINTLKTKCSCQKMLQNCDKLDNTWPCLSRIAWLTQFTAHAH